jgi:hypothetical protein
MRDIDPEDRFDALQQTIRDQLPLKLSSPELVSFPLSKEFQSSDLRFTRYERPV